MIRKDLIDVFVHHSALMMDSVPCVLCGALGYLRKHDVSRPLGLTGWTCHFVCTDCQGHFWVRFDHPRVLGMPYVLLGYGEEEG